MYEGLLIATSLLAIGLSGFAVYRQNLLSKRLESALGGLVKTKDGDRTLEETVVAYFKKLNATDKKLQEIRETYQYVSEIAATSLQKTAIVRFNPFRNTGGDQSFVLAMLDNHDSGFLLTSIHSREGTRVYIKPVSYGTSDYTLSNEESSALKQAVSGTSTKKTGAKK